MPPRRMVPIARSMRGGQPSSRIRIGLRLVRGVTGIATAITARHTSTRPSDEIRRFGDAHTCAPRGESISTATTR